METILRKPAGGDTTVSRDALAERDGEQAQGSGKRARLRKAFASRLMGYGLPPIAAERERRYIVEKVPWLKHRFMVSGAVVPRRLAVHPRGWFVWVLALAAAAPLAAEDWVGKKVYPVEAGSLRIRVGDQVVARTNLLHFTVLEDDGEKIKLAGGPQGYVLKTEVVPLERAVEHFTAKIAAEPTAAWLYQRRATVWRDKGEPDKAIADLSLAIRHKPSAAYYNSRGALYAEGGLFDRAIRDFDFAIDLNPKYVPALRNRGTAYYDKHDDDRAIHDFDEAIRLDGKYADAFDGRGKVYYRQGEYERAMGDYNAAIRLNPQHAHAHIGRARIMATCPDARLRNGPKAVESAQTACELTKHKDPFFVSVLAAAYAEAGDFAQAVRWQNETIRLASDKDRTHSHKRLANYKAKKPWREGPAKR